MLVFLNWWSIRHLHYAAETLWVCETVISRYQASDDDFLLEKSLVVFATFQGQYQESPEALQMLSLQVGLRPCQFVAYCLLVLSIRQPYTSGLSLGCSRLRRPIPVASICEASSVSAENYPCIAVSFGDCFHHPARSVIFAQLAQLCIFSSICLIYPNPLHRQNLQEHSDSPL